MPSTWSAKYCFIRVDGTDDSKVIQFFENKYSTIHIMKHKGSTDENPHYHIAVEFLADITKQTLSNNIKKHFAVEKDGFCVKKWDENPKAISYMYHEEEQVVVKTSYSDEQQAQFKATNEMVKLRKEASDKKPKDIDRWEMVLEIRKMSNITECDITNWNYNGHCNIDKGFVYTNMIKVLEKYKKLAHITEMERLYVSVLRIGYESTDFFEKIKSKVEV